VRIAILSRGDGWHVQDLVRAAAARGHVGVPIDFRTVVASVHAKPLAGFDAVLVRTMPAGSLEQVVFRMDVLHTAGVPVLNPPRAVETCVDKFLASARIAAAGIWTPETTACQTADDAQAAFETLGGDVVVKPLFGAEGRGMVRVSDPDLAWRTFHAIEQTQGVIYLQRFVRHPGWDVRAFVLNGKVLAAMKRTNPTDWRANVARGGTAERYEVSRVEAELAVKAAAATGAAVAGVDLLLDERNEWLVIEVNAVPGWRALAPVCGIDVADRVVGFLTCNEWRGEVAPPG
jgi:ribosomal protein S6--L-glutamate ligase